MSENGCVWGYFLYGIFGADDFRHAWLRKLGWQGTGTLQAGLLEKSLNSLAEAVENSLDMQTLENIIWRDG